VMGRRMPGIGSRVKANSKRRIQREEDLAKKLANRVESFAGEDDRAYVSATLLQPFVSYIIKTKTTFGLSQSQRTIGEAPSGRCRSTSQCSNC
jgi:hypothetical protein